jgi:hypothetical protein
MHVVIFKYRQVVCSVIKCLHKVVQACWLLALLLLRHWTWRRYIPQNRRFNFNELHGVKSKKIVLSMKKICSCIPHQTGYWRIKNKSWVSVIIRPRHSSSGQSLASHRGGPGSSPGLVMWELWWTKWRWGRFSPSTSVSPANLHSTNCSTITLIYHLGLVQ